MAGLICIAGNARATLLDAARATGAPHAAMDETFWVLIVYSLILCLFGVSATLCASSRRGFPCRAFTSGETHFSSPPPVFLAFVLCHRPLTRRSDHHLAGHGGGWHRAVHRIQHHGTSWLNRWFWPSHNCSYPSFAAYRHQHSQFTLMNLIALGFLWAAHIAAWRASSPRAVEARASARRLRMASHRLSGATVEDGGGGGESKEEREDDTRALLEIAGFLRPMRASRKSSATRGSAVMEEAASRRASEDARP